MQSLPDKLPDDVDALKALVFKQSKKADDLSEKNKQLATKNQQYKIQILGLQEQLNLALARRYASSSEKLSPDQLRLFTEAEVDQELIEGDSDETVTVPAHKRKKSSRKALPETLPRVDVIHDIPESERICPHDGAELQEMSEVISEQLDIIPAKIQVIRHIRKQYACSCGQYIKLAPLSFEIKHYLLLTWKAYLFCHLSVSSMQQMLPWMRFASLGLSSVIMHCQPLFWISRL